MIIFGQRASKIGEFDIDGINCSYCEQENSQHLSIYGKYAHIFWIPFFPFGKKAIAECNHCKKTYEQSEFTPELKTKYKQVKKESKRPIWHWFGLILFLGLSIILNIFANLSGGEPDPRNVFLQSDIEIMSFTPSMESDSISYKLKSMFDENILAEIRPEHFEYLTKTNENKALILVKIPKLKKVDKSVRGQIVEMIEMITNNQEDLKGKDKYIGVHGKYNFMMLKTPTDEESSNLVIESPLYDFYGPKPKTNEE